MGAMKSIYDPNYTVMIDRLKEIRKSRKVTQVALAEAMDWNHRDISKVEGFVRRLDLIELCYWLDALEYDLEDFLRDIGRLK
jgi:transcriptional regulator with XRE-family HTH domain